MELVEAIALLDPQDEDHWTANGLPRIDAIVEMLEGTPVTRQEVTDIAPELTRETAQEVNVQESTETFDDAGSTQTEDPSIADVEPDEGESVLSLPIPTVLNSYELCLRAADEISEKHSALLAKRSQVQSELDQLNAKNEILKRMIVRHERMRKAVGQETKPIVEYLKKQREVRAQKVQRARRFLQVGTTAQDVADELSTSSKLDAAMRRRNPPHGSKRPSPRPLVQ